MSLIRCHVRINSTQRCPRVPRRPGHHHGTYRHTGRCHRNGRDKRGVHHDTGGVNEGGTIFTAHPGGTDRVPDPQQIIDLQQQITDLLTKHLLRRQYGEQQSRTVTSGPGPGPNLTVAKLAVRVFNKPELSTWVQFKGKLPTRLNWAGCQQVAQRVHIYIQIRVLFLEFVNCILSKWRFQQPIMCFCMLCSLQYRLIWNRYFTFGIWCKGTYASVRPHRQTCGNYRNTVANVDASDSRCRCRVR